jgi:AbrB family looped-hinge helix DNA binding protein
MTYRLTVASNGRIVLPAEVRRRLDLLEGGDLVMEETPDGLVLRTVAQSVAHAQAVARRYLADRPDVSVDDFIAKRRKESGE